MAEGDLEESSRIFHILFEIIYLLFVQKLLFIFIQMQLSTCGYFVLTLLYWLWCALNMIELQVYRQTIWYWCCFLWPAQNVELLGLMYYYVGINVCVAFHKIIIRRNLIVHKHVGHSSHIYVILSFHIDSPAQWLPPPPPCRRPLLLLLLPCQSPVPLLYLQLFIFLETT